MNKIVRRGFTHSCTLGVAVALAALTVTAAPCNAKQLPKLLMILDASVSMEDTLGDELKYKLVRKAMGQALPAYSDKLQSGLVIFGRNSKNSCKDITRLVNLKPLNSKTFTTVINHIKPKGKSPIGASLSVAAGMAKTGNKPLHMLLMADGSDNCSANICATANLIARRSPKTKIHVIGLGKTAIVKRLSCASDATNGTFTTISSSAELATALNLILQTVIIAEEPAKQTLAVLTRPPLPNPRPLDDTKNKSTLHRIARFPQSVPLPVRSPTRITAAKASKPLVQANIKTNKQIAPKTEKKSATKVNVPEQQENNTPGTEARSLITNSIVPITAPEPQKADTGASTQWQEITEKPIIIAEAKSAGTPIPDTAPVSPPAPARAKSVDQPAPAPTFRGKKPSVEITLPETSASVKLGALITEQGKAIESGLVWRIYKSRKDDDGRYKLVKSLEAAKFHEKLPLGVYLVNLSWGRSHLTEKMDILSSKPFVHNFILNAGGLRLGARHVDGSALPTSQVSYQIYSDERDQFGKRRLIFDHAKPARTIRLNAGIYHIASLYGTANALIETDITIEAGKLTDAVINHSASKVTFKLVNAPGGEALAGAIWRISSPDGQLIKNAGGALPSLILAAGDYMINAKYSGQTFARKVSIEPGDPVFVEIVIQ